MALVRFVGTALLNTAVYGTLLFAPAGTLVWWRAWVLLGAVFAGILGTRGWFIGADGGLLAERGKAPLQPGQPPADKAIVVALLIVLPAYIAFIPVDVFRLHVLAAPSVPMSSLGLVAAAAGWFIVGLAFRANSFAAAIVRHQSDRGHAVVDRGVYAVIRHPLYLGVALEIVGAAVWLESYGAALASVAPLAVLVVRINVEETFLEARLPGYAAYTQRVRYRLLPGIW